MEQIQQVRKQISDHLKLLEDRYPKNVIEQEEVIILLRKRLIEIEAEIHARKNI